MFELSSFFSNKKKLESHKRVFFIYLGFLSRTFTNHRTAGEGEGHFFNFLLPLPPTSQTLRQLTEDYCRELTSTHSRQPDSNRVPLVSERKPITTKLRAHKYVKVIIPSENTKINMMYTQLKIAWKSFVDP